MTEKKSAPKSQGERFIETARALGCDEDEAAFERVFEKIVPPKRPRSKPDEKGEAKKPTSQ